MRKSRYPSPKASRLFRTAAAVTIILLLAACSWKIQANRPTADLILTNGAVYTMDASRSWADAVAIGGGKILYAGDSAGAEKFKSGATKIIDLSGKMVLPGFYDSHIHLITGGMELKTCNLSDLETRDAVFAKIREYAAQHKDDAWVVGGGWDLPLFPVEGPTKEQLDVLVPDRPAYFDSADGHSAWVNTKALQKAGVTAATPDPKDGRIERVKATGEPSGTFRESAKRYVAKLLPPPTEQDYKDGLRAGLTLANSFGITSILEADANEKLLETYADAERNGRLTARVLASLHVDPAKGLDQIKDLIARREKYRGPRLTATTAKIFADGVIESKTAALLEPYLDRPGFRGLPNLDAGLFDSLAVALDKAGFQIHVHAIGDAAIRMTLDAFAAAAKANGRRDARHHIAHLELIDPRDIPRFRELGVVANFQAFWAYRDNYISDMTEPALGPARSRWLYPIGSVLRTGALIAGGSDWSVSSMNPLDAIQVGITRRGLEDAKGPLWIPEEVVSLPEMLAAYTINGAYLSHREKTTGSIEAGKAADLVVLDKNLFDVPPAEIHKVKVVLTMLDGKEIYRMK